MKKLFIYYSLTHNGNIIADYLKREGYDIRKVITSEPLPNNNILRILSGGYKAMINYEDSLLEFDTNIEEYQEVIIGSPIWNDRLSSPINSVLNKLDLNNKKINFILYSGSGKNKNATKLIKERYPQANIINVKEPKQNKEELNKIKNLL